MVLPRQSYSSSYHTSHVVEVVEPRARGNSLGSLTSSILDDDIDEGGGGGCWQQTQKFFRNKWTRLVIYSFTCFTTSCLYYGWQQYSAMLFKGGAYAWLCPDGWDYDVDGVCDAQDKAVTRLYSIGCASEYSMALLAGFLLDTFGPKATGLSGELIYLIGIIMMMFSSQSFQAYIPSMILTAGCVNIVAFPSLILGDIFAHYSSMAQAIVIAAQTGCTLVAPTMFAAWNSVGDSVSFRKVWGFYALCIWLPVTILYSFALPTKKGFAKELAHMKKHQKIEEQQLVEQLGIPKTSSNIQANTANHAVHSSASFSSSEPIKLVDDGSYAKIETTHSEHTSISGVGGGAVSGADSLFPFGIHRQAIVLNSIEELTPATDWKSFWHFLASPDWLCIAAFYMIVILQYNYYPSVVRSAVSDKVSNFVGWFMPTQMVWGVLGGLFMDFAGTTIFNFILILGVAICYGLVMIRNEALEFIVATMFVIFQASVFTIKYTFVSEMYDKPHYGKLVGCLGLLGGVASLCNMPVTNSSNYNAIFYSYAALCIPLVFLALWLLYRQLRKGKCYRTQPLENTPWTMRKANQEILARQARLEHQLEAEA